MQLFEVVLRSNYFGQECVNAWNYVAPSSVPAHLGAFMLLDALGFFQEGDPLAYPADKVFAKILAISGATVSFTDIYAKNIYDPEDFYEQPFNPAVHGTRSAGGQLSPTVALGFRTSRVRTDISRGQKRFVGVGADDMNSGGSITSTLAGFMDTLATAMSENVSADSSSVTYQFHPTIVQKRKPTGAPGMKGYTYYPTIEEQSAHWAQNFAWSKYPQTRTQVSRQYGRGQ